MILERSCFTGNAGIRNETTVHQMLAGLPTTPTRDNPTPFLIASTQHVLPPPAPPPPKKTPGGRKCLNQSFVEISDPGEGQLRKNRGAGAGALSVSRSQIHDA